MSEFELSVSDVSALRAENEWVVDLVESSRLPMVALDDERRYVALSDAALAKHVGRSREDLLGRQVEGFLDPEGAKEFIGRFEALQASDFVVSRVPIRGGDGITREVTALLSREVAPGISLGVTLSGVETPTDSGEGSRKHSVLVCAPDEMTASIVAATCGLDKNFEVVAECLEPERLGAMVLGHRPSVVVVATSPFGGLENESVVDSAVKAVEEAVGTAKTDSYETGVLALTHLSRPDLVRRVIAAGALGVFGPNENPALLSEALRSVAAGNSYISPSLAVAIAVSGRGGPAADMTPREIEVLRLLALGYTNQDVADELFLSVRTIEGHHTKINGLLGSSKRKDLVAFALDNEIIP